MRRFTIFLLLLFLAGCKPPPDVNLPVLPSGSPSSQMDLPPTGVFDLADDPLIPAFRPSYPCQLQNETASISEGDDCRSEAIREVIAAEGDEVLFIHRTHQRSYGCGGGTNIYTYRLSACSTVSGESVTLSDKEITELVPSPDGAWFAFGEIDVQQLEVHVYRVGSDGTGLLQLDSISLPNWVVGVVPEAWSPDGKWLGLKLWDGTADGWHSALIATDGSGILEMSQDE
ncbi:MAG: TolB family protein [Candidatus Promineifilaceae bacterium]|jgi:hypothetical protein